MRERSKYKYTRFNIKYLIFIAFSSLIWIIIKVEIIIIIIIVRRIRKHYFFALNLIFLIKKGLLFKRRLIRVARIANIITQIKYLKKKVQYSFWNGMEWEEWMVYWHKKFSARILYKLLFSLLIRKRIKYPNICKDYWIDFFRYIELIISANDIIQFNWIILVKNSFRYLNRFYFELVCAMEGFWLFTLEQNR